MHLNEMCVTVFDISPTLVYGAKPAPPRFFLSMFGGHLDITTFRALSLTTHTVLLQPPFVSHAMVLESHSIDHQAQEDEVDGVREGHHVLRGLRRPVEPLKIMPESSIAGGRFEQFVQERQVQPAKAIPIKKRRKEKEEKTDDAFGSLNSFLIPRSDIEVE